MEVMGRVRKYFCKDMVKQFSSGVDLVRFGIESI